jgi:hypothetical protein
LTLCGQKILTMFHEEYSTPRKVVFCIFLYNLVKASRTVEQNLQKPEKLLGNLQDSLLNVFTIEAAVSSNYNQLRYYCLAGLAELMMAGVLTPQEVEIDTFRHRLKTLSLSYQLQ